jgi:hypothetical protein
VSAPALLRAAAQAGVTLRLVDGKSRVSGVPSPDLLARLRANKDELTQILTGDRCRGCGERLDYQRDWNTRAFADGTGMCGPCYYLEAAERALHSPDALTDPAEVMLRGEIP